MAAKKRNRQQVRAKQAAAARRALEMDRRRRVRKRRMSAGAVVALVAAVGVVAIVLAQGESGTDLAATTSTTSPEESVPETLPSAAGKPCLPLGDPLPQGAPAVPVKVGPPPTSLVIEDLKPGTGAEVAAGQTLTVNYIGVACSTGKIFDASYTNQQPATFPLSGVIPGWQEGIPGMKVGGQRLLGIPPDKAYGDEGGGTDIAPGETLWFVVEVLDAKTA